ncbi:MAG: sugar phosphate nucleotidyltransferase [Candidatus Krumholzibacteriia bacterium]
MREDAAHIARAMVLAAGYGTRLRPLTDRLPKPLVPVLGRPLLARVVEGLRAAGARRIAINSHHLPEQIARCVEQLALSDHACEYRLLHEPDILGTGGALVNARAFLDQGEPFLLHNGDVLTDLDLSALAAAHRAGGALVTLALADDAATNSVLLAPDGTVLDINGRHGAAAGEGARLLTYTGVAVVDPALFGWLPGSGYATLVEALLSAIAERPGAVRGVAPAPLYWNDLGTVARLLGAHRDLLVAGQCGRPRPTAGGPALYLAEGATIAPDAHVEGFLSLGRAARVAGGARLVDCVVLDGVTVPAGAVWRRALLGLGWAVTQEENEIPRLAIVRGAGFGPDTRVEPLVEQGSDRSFWRLCAPAGVPAPTAVLMRTAADDPELPRYLAVGRFLEAERLGGPRLLAADAAHGAVLMEDLGDATLHRLATTTLEPLGDLYRPVLDLLVELQVRGTAALARCAEAGDRLFDYDTLRWETDYFRQRFLVEACGVPAAGAAALDDEFARLARAALAQPVVLMHRDFQSQNILFHDGRVRLVDFQGMRRGPLLYDLVSLLRDPYVDLPAVERGAFLDYYGERLAARGGPDLPPHLLRRMAAVAGLQRIMQALGAFAFLSRVKGKAWYTQWIPAGLRQLDDLLGEIADGDGEPGPLPRLAALVRSLPNRTAGPEGTACR